jgi:UDP-N-acetylmuramate--alanine ligase
MDLEHLDCYASMEEITEAFLQFINRIPFYGYAILCLDDPHVQAMIPTIHKRFITYGLSSQATFRAAKPHFDRSVTSFSVSKEERVLGEVRLPMPGLHNVVDALAAIAVADVFEIPFEVSKQALDSFPGVQRRFTLRGTAHGVSVIDDYGHHPTEIRAVLQAAGQLAQRRIVVLFQPHRYTRTKALFDEFLTSFNNADLLYVMDIYPAGEKPIEGVTGKALYEGIRSRGHKSPRFLWDRRTIAAQVAKDLEPGDMVITLGAGDVTIFGAEILEELRRREVKRP